MILKSILRNKKIEIRSAKHKKSLRRLKVEVSFLPKKKRVFLGRLKQSRGMAVIAEIKQKSPSKGVLRKNFDPVRIAESYRRGGARALSVLTDRKFFGGSLEILKKVRRATTLPLLRKDFLLEEYQVYESRLLGADAVLLIASVLSKKALATLGRLAEKLGMDVLFEAHDRRDLSKILYAKPKMIGINNRDLSDFSVDIKTTEKLVRRIPKNILCVSESGIQTSQDLIYLKSLGIKAVLVGEELMKAKKPESALRRLLRNAKT